MPRIARALLSVHNKDGIVALGRALQRHGVEILSTGGTASLLEKEGVPVVRIADFTGAPEILGGRVKTLHPAVAGGILAVRDNPAQQAEMAEHGIRPIDLVVVNLYPFSATVARPGVTLEDAIENIDIGGPTMIRAAAKNHRSVAVVVDPSDYGDLTAELDGGAGGEISQATRERLAVRAFEHTAAYDAAVSSWLGRRLLPSEAFPPTRVVASSLALALRYGENPHQRAAFYRTANEGLGAFIQHQGKELSYNNLLDLDAAMALAGDLGSGAAVIVKHTNPCGAASGAVGSLGAAYRRARACDPTSAFGGVVALAGEVGLDTAVELTSTFLEVVAAPSFTPEALAHLTASKKGLRVLSVPLVPQGCMVMRSIAGGVLVQDADAALAELDALRVVTKRAPSAAELQALRFAWVVAKHVKSNAIVFADGAGTVGIGAGQMSRIDSARIAAEKAVLPLGATVCASDGFFPFRDGLDAIAKAGAVAVIQPGGSVRDDEVVAAADEHGMAMVLTGARHFRH